MLVAPNWDLSSLDDEGEELSDWEEDDGGMGEPL